MAAIERQTLMLQVLQDYAPTGEAQEKCSEFYNNLLRKGVSDRYIELTMARALMAGLTHGNWPWKVGA